MLDLGGYNHSYAVELEKLRNYLAFFHKYVFCTFCKLCMFQGCFLCWYRYGSSLALKDHAEMWLVRGCPRVSAAPIVWVALSAALVAKTIGEGRVCPRRHDLPCPRVSAVLVTCVVCFSLYALSCGQLKKRTPTKSPKKDIQKLMKLQTNLATP